MVINHNLSAMNANRQLGINNGNQGKSIEKLSSGLKINRAGDDAAGLAISEKMRSQIRGLDQGSSNAQDGISLIQTAEGTLSETQAMVQRLKTLSTQAANGTLQDSDRTKIQLEVKQLVNEISRLSTDTTFNGKKILNGDITSVSFQVGATAGQRISLSLSNVGATALSLASIDLSTQGNASLAMVKIDAAIGIISSKRATLGSVQNRLEHTITATDNTSENLSAAESRIRDVDMAKEMMNYSSQKVLVQAAQSMLAQANQTTSGVLSLLQ
ncbi:flagellin [Clostridium beijerinckii]|uniref:flagellin N-terminal helical domain-containing protein n=1 Tax=Clostridium beijerinckii TaxID=1520 RepID=UPI0015712FE5|nr:flagellin [Clostridium beijerinckii]NRT73718.1 flagellin [Clostridium beijerinckii]